MVNKSVLRRARKFSYCNSHCDVNCSGFICYILGPPGHEFPGKFPVFQLSTSTFPSRSITGCDAWKNIKAVSSSWRWQVFESSKCFADKPFIHDPS